MTINFPNNLCKGENVFNMCYFQLKEMDQHKQYVSKYCRLCDKQDDNIRYNVKTFAVELNFEYEVDIDEDVPSHFLLRLHC